MYTYFYKKSGAEGWLDISCLINSSRTSIVNGICTKDFKSTTNTASFEVIPVDAYIGLYRQVLEDILIAQSDMGVTLEAKILIDDVIVASGYIDIASVSIQSTKVAGRIKISIRDYIVDLDKKCKANLVRENVNTTPLIEELLEMAEIHATLNASDMGSLVHHFVVTSDDNNTFRDIIDALLFELGNKVLYRNPADGSYNIIPVISTETPTKIVNYLINKSLSTTSKIWDHDGVIVKYPSVESKENMSMYIDDASTKVEGVVVPAKGFYPKDGDVKATYQEYRKEILDYEYNSKISRRQNGDIDLLYVKDAHIEVSPSDTFTTPLVLDVELDVNPKFLPRKAQCLLYNNTDKEVTLKQFDIIGTAVYRSAFNSYTIPEKPTQPQEYEASYIETDEEAKAFAAGYLNLSRYGSTMATWTTTADAESYPVGKPVIVRHKADNHLSQGFTVISTEITHVNGIAMRKYVAIANSRYNQYEGVVNTSKPTVSTGKQVIRDVQQFYLSTDPEIPTGGVWSENTVVTPPKNKYLFTRRFVRYIDSSEYIGAYYRIGVGEDGKPAMTLQLSRLTYHYDSKGNLTPPNQMIKATVTGVPRFSPIHWKINGELLQTQEETIEVPPSYMKHKDFIEIEASLEAMRVSNTIVRVMDGADYIPVVQYKYSSSKDNPDADSYMIAYGNIAIAYGNYKLAYGNELWTDTAPIGDKYNNMYLWKRTWSYKLDTWLYERVNDIAVVFEVYPSSYTYKVSPRATVDTEIGFTYRVQGITGSIAWKTTIGEFIGSTLILPSSIESMSVTVTATYGGLERSVTLEGILSDNEPIYGGIRGTAPTDKKPIDGDYYMSEEGIPMRYNSATKTWVALDAKDINQSEIMERCGKDWIAHGKKVNKTMAAVYGYFQQLYSDSVVAESIDTDQLMARKLQLKEGGAIYGGGYDENGKHKEGKGVYVSSEGELKAYNATINGIVKSDAFETNYEIPNIDATNVRPEYQSEWNSKHTRNIEELISITTRKIASDRTPLCVCCLKDGKIITDKAYSFDYGNTWTQRNIAFSISQMVYFNNIFIGCTFVDVYSDDNGVYISEDGGVSFTKTFAVKRALSAGVYIKDNYIYLHVHRKSWEFDFMYRSSDGKKWDLLTETSIYAACPDIQVCDGKFIAKGKRSRYGNVYKYMYSDDGITWFDIESEPQFRLVWYKNNNFYGVKQVYNTSTYQLYRISPNGNIAYIKDVPDLYKYAICGDMMYFVSAPYSHVIYYSRDGVNIYPTIIENPNIQSMNFSSILDSNEDYLCYLYPDTSTSSSMTNIAICSKVDITPISSFFNNIRIKLDPEKTIIPTVEPLSELQNVTALLRTDYTTKKIIKLKVSNKSIHIVFDNGEAVIFSNNNAPCYSFSIDNLTIKEIKASTILGNTYPMNAKTFLGNIDNPFEKGWFNHLFIKNIKDFDHALPGEIYVTSDGTLKIKVL